MVALLAAPSRLCPGSGVSVLPQWHGQRWFAWAFANSTVVVLLSAFMQWCHRLSLVVCLVAPTIYSLRLDDAHYKKPGDL
jgi:hypothetical protein